MMADEQTSAEQYIPTLLEYAEVIAWLREEVRYCDRNPIPDHLKRAYDDAIRRESLGRIAKVMQVAEDAGDDGLGDMLGSWSE